LIHQESSSPTTHLRIGSPSIPHGFDGSIESSRFHGLHYQRWWKIGSSRSLHVSGSLSDRWPFGLHDRSLRFSHSLCFGSQRREKGMTGKIRRERERERERERKRVAKKKTI
jgi:hypothetical protein